MMKTRVIHVNGIAYLYAYDSLCIGKGKSKQISRSLGQLGNLINPEEKKRAFADYVRDEEMRLRVEYWSRLITDASFQKYVSLEKIERLRTALYRAKENMGDIGRSALEANFQIDFVYNSNKLEGSKVPRERIEEVRKGKAKNAEVQNSLRALHYIEDESFVICPSAIRKLHTLLLAHEPDKLGWRTEEVVVGSAEAKVSHWQNIQKELNALCTWYKTEKKKIYPPKLAFDFYYKFERIHPFIDGNGRVGRLLMNKIFRDNKYHPIIVWNKRQKAHLASFAKRIEGGAHFYYKFMTEQFTKTHEIYLEKIRSALDLEKLTEELQRPSEYNF